MHTDNHSRRCHEYDHYNAVESIKILPKTRRHVIAAARFIDKCAIECDYFRDITSKTDEAMVAELTVYAAANLIEFVVYTLVIL